MFARDKKLHFWAGLALAIIAGLFLYPAIVWLSWKWLTLFVALGASVLGLLIAAVAGALKEIVWDLWWKRGCFEWLDFGATCLGGVVGSLIVKLLKVG